MKNYVLEVCIDSLESAVDAVNGGATRLELCANLVIGGTTPSIYLFREIRKVTDIPVNAIIRPRFGDFCNTETELKIMAEEIKQFKAEGVNGIVSGVLKIDGNLDMRSMELLRGAAEGLDFTLHRAFDMCVDPIKAVKEAESLGINTILTSGQKNSCPDGVLLLKELAGLTKVDIMAGAGLTLDAIRKIRKIAGLTSYHLSGKVIVDSPMVYRKEDVSMGLPSLSEYEIWRTSADNIAAVKKVLEEID